MQVDQGAQSQIASLDLSNCFVEEGVEGGHSHVVDLAGTPGHEVILEGNRVSLPKLCRPVFISMQHLSYHHLCKRVFLDATRSLVDKHIVEDLCETFHTVIEGNG